MITKLNQMPSNPKEIHLKKGAMISVTYSLHTGGIIEMMIFTSAVIEDKEYIKAEGIGSLHAVFTHDDAIIKNREPYDSLDQSQYIPYGFSQLEEHKIENGRFLIVKEAYKNYGIRMFDEDRHQTYIIDTDDNNVLLREIKTVLLNVLPMVGIDATDNKWNAVKIINGKVRTCNKRND
jgi:hypothetical protein